MHVPEEVTMAKKFFKFWDFAEINYYAGMGGEPCSSRRKHRNHWMNIGGNGGAGGDIYIKIKKSLRDLSEYAANRPVKAEKGEMGGSHQKKGHRGSDTTIYVPRGTYVRKEDGTLIVDMLDKDEPYLLAKGGKGGIGNYKRETTIAPDAGEKGTVYLDYRIPIDVVLIGPANSGKSTFMEKCTKSDFNATPYPYTTYHPVWGMGEKDWKEFIIMEMPALVGKEIEVEPVLKYVRQIKRAKLVIYFMDAEIENFSEVLGALRETVHMTEPGILKGKRELVVANKCDLNRIEKDSVINISLETGEGVDALLDEITKTVCGK